MSIHIFFGTALVSVSFAQDSTATAEVSVTTPQPKLATISIGGRDVIKVVNDNKYKVVPFDIPDDLNTPTYLNILKRRHSFPIPKYAPHTLPDHGFKRPDYTIIEFSDPGCFTCQADIIAMEEALENARAQAELDDVQRFHIYAQSETSGPLGLSAFYARVADRIGAFWAYHKALTTLTNPSEHDYFTILSELGATPQDIRQIAISDTRRIYEELDADIFSVQTKPFPKAPFWLINGILVARDAGIPLHLIPSVFVYEKRRLTAEKLGARQ